MKAVTSKTVLTAVFVFALAASAAAAPQRGGGHFGGGGRVGGGGHFGGGGVGGHFGGGPRHGRFIVRGGFADPFWGSYYPYWGYPYGYGYPYGAYYSLTPRGDVKAKITPKQTEVYVDGYYAGVADDFDGTFQQLHTSPGGHTITLRLDGYRTVTENVYVRPGSTVKLKETMEKLAPGEVSQPVPAPKLPARRSDSMTPAPDAGSAPQR